MVELSWSLRPSEAQVTAIVELLAAATEADQVAPVSEQVVLQLRTPAAPGQARSLHLLATTAGGEPAGYAHLAVGDTAKDPSTGELAVHPAHRSHGVGAELVRALIDRAPGQLKLWAHGELPAAVRLAERLGFTRGRELLQLRRSLLDPLPELTVPAGVLLRPFVADADEAAMVAVNNRAFHWHPEQGGWDVEQVRVREREPWFDPDGFLLAVDQDGQLLGYHWTKIHGTADAGDRIGEVYVLGVDPAAHGRGLGGTLTVAGLRYLREQGLDTVLLYVEADNAPAIAVYRRLGFEHWKSDVVYVR